MHISLKTLSEACNSIEQFSIDKEWQWHHEGDMHIRGTRKKQKIKVEKPALSSFTSHEDGQWLYQKYSRIIAYYRYLFHFFKLFQQ